MDHDIITRLGQAAYSPADPLDVADLERRTARLRRRRVIAVLSAAAAVLLAAPIGIAVAGLGDGKDSPVIVRPAPSQNVQPPIAGDDQGLQPATRIEGRQIVMPITFPDGTGAELVFPRKLAKDMRRFVVHPYGSGALPDCCQRDFTISAGKPGYAQRGTPLKSFPGDGGRPVTYWQGPGSAYLLFEFGRWYVGVWDGAGGDSMTDDKLRIWAKSLRGTTTAGGFLVLRPTPPLQLAKSNDPNGPTLQFQSPGRTVDILLDRKCPPGRPTYDRGEDGWSLQVCKGGVRISGQASADDKAFLSALGTGLQVRHLGSG